MPNWTQNTITAEGLGDMPIFSVKDGKKVFDFNRIIPMPEELIITCGGSQEEAVAWYMTDRGSRPGLTDDELDIMSGAGGVSISAETAWYRIAELLSRADNLAAAGYGGTLYANGRQYVDNYRRYGAPTWYDWACRNWGTKWNACYTHIEGDSVYFETAWTPPLPVIAALSAQHPDVEFDYGYTYEEEYMDAARGAGDASYDDFDGWHAHETVWLGGNMVG